MSRFESSPSESSSNSENPWVSGFEHLSPEQPQEDTPELPQDDRPELPHPKLRKIGEQQGSNDGGWYEDEETGEKFYVKFYENPDQGRSEFIANAVYARLGIKSVQSRIIMLDGREAIASPAVPNAHSVSMERQRTSEDVRSGFVADAYLANWDVVGLVYDNIVQSDEGFFRIDNGGSLIFRAQGGDKEYSPHSIPELQSLLVPTRPAGRVFEGITQQDIEEQAQTLLANLSEDDIREIVEQSGMTGRARERVLDGMLGRRRYLESLYGGRSGDSPEAEGGFEA